MSVAATEPAQHSRLAALYEISRALNSSLNLEEALVIVMDAAIRLCDAERGFLMLIDERSGELSFRMARNARQETIEESAFEISRSVVQEVVRTGAPVVTMDAQRDPRFGEKASVVNFVLRSIMAVPLRSQGHVIGALYVDNKTRTVRFDQNDLDLLGAFADKAVTAIVNAQLFEAQKREAEIRRVLLEVAHLAQRASSARELFTLLAHWLPAWLGCDRCVLVLRDADEGTFRVVACSDPELQPFFENLGPIYPDQIQLSDQVRHSRQAIIVTVAEFLDGLPMDWLAVLRPGEALVIPIHSDQGLIGVLALDNGRSDRPFSPLTLTLAESLGDHLATAIQRLQLFETSQRQLKELSALSAVAVAATEAASVAALCEQVQRAIKPLLKVESLAILLIDEAAGVFRITSPLEFEQTEQIALGRGIVGQVAATGQPRRISDVSKEPAYLRLLPFTSSELCVPLKIGDRVVGVINAESSVPNAFTASDERLLTTIAGQLATGLEKLRLLETERQQRHLAEVLRDAGLALTVEADLDVVLDRLMGYIARVVPFDAAGTLLVEDGVARLAGVRGYAQFGSSVLEAMRALRLDVSQTRNLRYMAVTGQPLIVADTASDPTWLPTGASSHLRSWIGVPVTVQGQCVAFLSLEKVEPGFYQAHHAERLAAFAGHAALAFRNAQLFQAAKRQAVELEAVRRASLSLTSSLDIQTVLNAILESTLHLLPGAQAACIFFYNNDRLTFGAELWAEGLLPQRLPEPRPNGLTYTVARQGEPIFVSDMATHPLFEKAPDDWRGAIISLPLKIGSRVVGVMNISYAQPRPMRDSEVHILRLLAEQAAAAIENASLFEAVRRQVDELTLLHAVATAGTENISSNELIQRATHMIGQALRARCYGVLLVDASNSTLVPHASFHGPHAVRMPVGLGISGRVAVTGRPWRVNDVRQEPTYVAINPDTLSEMCVPLRVNERVIGVIEAESDQPQAFTENDERLLSTIAGQLALAIEKTHLLEAERSARAQAETLRDVASLLNATLERESLVNLILDQLARLVKYDSGSVLLLEGQHLVPVAARGLPPDAHIADALQPDGARHLHWVLVTGQPLIIPDTHADERWRPAPGTEAVRCWLGVPLIVKEKAVGVINLNSGTPGFYSAHDAESAFALANQAAVALERLRLLEETQQLFQAEREQRQLAEALRDAAVRLGAALDVDAVLDQLLDLITSVVPFDTANLMLVDGDSGAFRVVRQRGYERFGAEVVARLQDLMLPIASLPTLRQMAETGQPLLIASAEDFPGWVQVEPFTYIRSWIGAPIMAQGKALAFFNLDKVEANFYQPKHVQRLAAFAGQAALALQNARLFEAERRRVSSLTMLHKLELELSAQLQSPALLKTILTNAMRLLEAQRGGLYTRRPNLHLLDLAVAYNLPPHMLGQSVPYGEGVAGLVAQTGEPLLVGDYPMAFGRDEPVEATRLRSVLAMPIQWQGQLLGVLVLLDERLQRFSASDVELLRLLADRAAIAIENVRLYGALDAEKQRLELLFNLSQSLASTLNPKEVAFRAMGLMCATTGASRSNIFTPEPDTKTLRPIQLFGYSETEADAVADVRLALGEGIVGHAALTRKPVIAADVTNDPHWVHLPGLDDGVRSAIALPLLAGDELVGVLSLLSDREPFSAREHVPLLLAATVPVALALQNARLFEQEAGRVYYLTLLNEITQAAVTIEDWSALLQAMTDRLGEMTGADACYLTLWDDVRGRPLPAAAYGPERETFAAPLNPQPELLALTETALRRGHSLVIEDSRTSAEIDPALRSNLPPESMLVLPLIAGDQKLGAALVTFRLKRIFTPEDVQRSEQAARQIALAIARARLFDEIRRTADELGVASDLLRTLNISPGVLRDFPALAAGLKLLTRCQYVTMALLADDRQSLLMVGLDQTPVESDTEMRLPIDADFIAPKVLAGQSDFVPDLAHSQAALHQLLAQSGLASCATLPLHGGERVIGVLTLMWSEPAGYAKANLTLINQLVDALALAVEKDRLLNETLRRAAELEAITDVSAALRSVNTSAEALNVLVDELLNVFWADHAAIMMPTEDGERLRFTHHRGLSETLASRTIDVHTSVAGRVLLYGRPHRSVDSLSDPFADQSMVQAMYAEEGRARTALFAPLRSGKTIIGVLVVGAPAPRVFSEADLRLLNTLAEVGGNALHRARVLETLEQRVAERTRELADANERLKELDRLKDQFLSNVSHELRTPLTAIKLHLGLLDKRGPELLPRYLPVLQRETERLHRLIEELLDLARLRSESAPLKLELYQLDKVLDDVLTLFRARADDRGVTLIHAANGSVPLVMVDVAQITQVFTNLIANAVNYASRGGRVSVGSSLESFGALEGVTVRVHNEGPAIPPEDLPHLFTRFYRGKTGRESGEPGTGLGLAICKEIVERHDGYIDITSLEGEGTTVMVWLPLTASASL